MSEKTQIELRPFQRRVFSKIMQGQSVLLQAPTGSGKTRAALAPFLQSLADCLTRTGYESRLPQTCRYAVPLRVLASQFYNEYEAVGAKLDRHFATRLISTYKRFEHQPVHIQTGEQPDDPQFESALTFCTIDQLLASFLGFPYGMGQRRAHLNVGAVVGSYLVLDEFHLYPLARENRGCYGARTTTLQMLELLHGRGKHLTPFVLMTATFSSDLLKEMADLLDAEIVRIESQDELDEISDGRERRFVVHTAPMRAAEIVDMHRDCSLVVCNTVLRAQQRYLEICAEIRQRKLQTRPILIHSRFTDKDRQDKQRDIEKQVGKGAWKDDRYLGEDVIIVATQVVEVGLDISVRTLHSEGAPANSIIQRAGRCARFAKQHGRVHLYPLAEGESSRPYNAATTVATLIALRDLDDRPVGFLEEQQVIDAVHKEEDRKLLEQYKHERLKISQSIFHSLTTHERSAASQLIRDVQQVTLLIHDAPNGTITERPWDWQTFSLHPGTLEGRWQTLLDRAIATRDFADDRPIAWEAQIDEVGSAAEENERRITRYRWEPVTGAARARSAFLLALSPEVATYNDDLGLVLHDGRLPMEWPDEPFRSQLVEGRRSSSGGGYVYDQESYAEHITGLLNAYTISRLRDDSRFIAARLEQAANLWPGAVDDAIRVAIALHDIGKLGKGWQGWAAEWQALLAREQGEHYRQHKTPLAHTDYDPRLHRDLQRRVKAARPPHACESAWLAGLLIAQILGDKPIAENPLARAVITAIAHHHGAMSREYQPITLIPDAQRHIQAMLDLLGHGRAWRYDLSELDTACPEKGVLDDELTRPDADSERQIETWLYFVIVRALVLADGRSFTYR